MKKLIVAIVALVALTGPLYAQMSKQSHAPTALQMEDIQKKKDAEKAEKEYQAAIKKTQGQEPVQTVVDPWQNLRGVDNANAKR